MNTYVALCLMAVLGMTQGNPVGGYGVYGGGSPWYPAVSTAKVYRAPSAYRPVGWYGRGWTDGGWNGYGWGGQGNGYRWGGQGWNGYGWAGPGWNSYGWSSHGPWGGQGSWKGL